MVLGPYVEPQELEHNEEHVLVVQLAVAYQLVWCVGHETLETCHECVHVPGAYIPHQFLYDGLGFSPVQRCVPREEEFHEPFLDFLVWKVEGVEPEFLVIVPNGQISALVYYRNGLVIPVDVVEDAFGHFRASEMLQVKITLLQQLHEISGRSRLEPVASELSLAESVEEAERIVYPLGLRREAVSVVHLPQFPAGLVTVHALRLRQLMQALFHIPVDLAFGNAAQRYISVVHRDVVQVVEVAEYAHLAELCHPREHGEPDMPVQCLEHPVERLQHVPELLLQGLVPNGLKQGLVVLVHEYCHPVPCLLMSSPDDAGQAQGQGCLRRIASVDFLPVGQSVVKDGVQTLGSIVPLYIQVYMQHRPCRPVFLHPLHRKPLEKLLFALEIGLQSGDEQTLAESSGTTEEIVAATVHQLVDKFCLVNVEISVPTDLLEVLYADRVFHVVTFNKSSII